MTFDNLSRVLLRNIELRNWSDASVRAEVYMLARKSLERFFESTTDADRTSTRAHMESAIASVEAYFRDRSLEELPPATEAAEEAPHPPSIDSGARIVDVENSASTAPKAVEAAAMDRADDPPPASIPPSEPQPPLPEEESPTVAPREIAAETGPDGVSEPGRGSPLAEPPAIAASAPNDGATETLVPEEASDEDASLFETGEPPDSEVQGGGTQEDEATGFRLGRVMASLALILLIVAWNTDLAGGIRRWLAERSAPEDITRPAIAEIRGIHTPEVTRPGRPPLRHLADRNGASTFLRIEGSTDGTRLFQGRLVWVPSEIRSGDVTTWSGHLEFDGSSIAIDLVLEREDGRSDATRRILGLALSGLGDVAVESLELARWDSTIGERRDVDGLTVRIGLDRFLIGFALEPADLEADFEDRNRFEVTFAADDGRHWVFQFTLPDPA